LGRTYQKSAALLRQVAITFVPGLRFDIVGVFLHGVVAETGYGVLRKARKVFPDIDPESWDEDREK
jgi:hypothetical protein